MKNNKFYNFIKLKENFLDIKRKEIFISKNASILGRIF
jgi:hypothetical protein